MGLYKYNGLVSEGSYPYTGGTDDENGYCLSPLPATVIETMNATLFVKTTEA